MMELVVIMMRITVVVAIVNKQEDMKIFMITAVMTNLVEIQVDTKIICQYLNLLIFTKA